MFTCRFDKYYIAPTDYLRSQCGTLETPSVYSSIPWSSYEVCHVLVSRWQRFEWSRMVLNWTNLNQIQVESGICMLVQRVCKCVCLFPSNLLILFTHEDACWKTNLGRPQDKHNQTPGKRRTCQYDSCKQERLYCVCVCVCFSHSVSLSAVNQWC